MDLTELALARAGAPSLSAFQMREGLPVTGEWDLLTEQAMLPYLIGSTVHRIVRGDTFYRLARRYGTTVQAILTANPALDPNRLQPGELVVVPFSFPVVPTDVPFTSELTELCLLGLQARYPALRVQTIARTRWLRRVSVVSVGSGARRVFYNASHHANEWITTPVLLRFLEELCLAASQDGSLGGVRAQELLRTTTLYLAPMVNPDGVDLVTGAIAPGSDAYRAASAIAAAFPDIPFPDGWKANLDGVDLNLNYPAGWEQAREIKFAQGYTRPAPRDYVGKAPLDQPESAAMAAFTRMIAPELILAYHTQGEVIYWKYLDDEPPGARALGERFAALSGYTLEDTPYASGFAGYKDWFIEVFRRPGYTIECGRGENPLPLDQFDTIYRDNLGILVQGMLGKRALAERGRTV